MRDCEYKCPRYDEVKCNEEHERCLRWRRRNLLAKLERRFGDLPMPKADEGYQIYLELQAIEDEEDKDLRNI